MTRKSKIKISARIRQARFGGSYASHVNQLNGTRTSVRDQISRVIPMARARKQADAKWTEEWRKTPGHEDGSFWLNEIPPSKDDPSYEAYIASDAESERLEKALLAMPEHVLRKIQAVMYMGRDGDDYDGLLRHLADTPHDHRAESMAGKLPLDEYLEKGLQLANDRGLNLDAELTE